MTLEVTMGLLDNLQCRLEWFDKQRPVPEAVIRDVLKTYNRLLDDLKREELEQYNGIPERFLLYRQWRNQYECKTRGEGL